MKLFLKSNKLDHVGYDVRGPVLDAAEHLAAEGNKILQLNTGNPAAFGFHAPEPLLETYRAHLQDAEGYCDARGILTAREAIAQHYREKGIPDVTASDVYTGNGVSELISLCMQALLNDGDEILIPAPDYPLWTAAATLSGGKVVHYLCDEQSKWYPDIADIRKKVSPRTKAIVIINPNNPTGALYPKEVLLEIAQIAREEDLIVFADEIYDSLVMDGNVHHAFASIAPDLFTISLNGLSKSHQMAGFRVGWMCLCGDKRRAKGYLQGIHTLASMRLCANVPAQHIISPALQQYTETDALLQPGGRIYEQREAIVSAINAIPGLSCTRPDAAFYVFPRLDSKRFRIRDDERFVLDFLRAHHVLFVHGRGFHWPQPDHFRIVTLPEVSQLQIVAKKLGIFLADYRQ